MGKWYNCEQCGKNLSSYHSLWRHKKTCKNRPQIVDSPPNPLVTDDMQVSPEEAQEDRVDRTEVLSLEIDDLLDKMKKDMDERIEQLKDDIWHNICEYREVDEKEGGSLEPGKMISKKNEDENEGENEDQNGEEAISNTKKWYQDVKKEREMKYDVFHKVVAKSMKKLVEILTDATKETNYEFDDVMDLLHQYFNEKFGDVGYRDIIKKAIHIIKVFQKKYWGSQAHLGYEAEILVRSMENLRILINDLVEIIGSKDDLPLKRLLWSDMITVEEYVKFVQELTPDIITNVLKQRKVVNYDVLQEQKQLKLII